MKEQNKKKNLLLLIIKILILFLITDYVVSRVPALMTRAVNTGKYGLYFIVELFAALVVFIVLLLSKNSYIFTEKKEKFFKSIFLGLPILLISGLMLTFNLTEIFNPSLNLSNVITLILFCISIGIYEEFLCRGWVLNEFLEQYGKTRRQVITSIFISSLIFGIMHISNIWVGGQTVVETVLQIVQATAAGVLFGSVYYRSKNIWSVVFLHSFYDFTIMLGSVNALKDCHTINEVLTVSSIVFTITISLVYLLYSGIILRKSKVNHLIEGEPELSKKDYIKSENKKKIYTILILFLVFMPSPSIDEPEIEQICYEYEEKELPEREIHYSNYKTFEFTEEITTESHNEEQNVDDYFSAIVVENINLKFKQENNRLIININDLEASKDFNYPIELLVLKQPDHYLIFIHEQNPVSGESKIYYSRYIHTGSLNINENYINEVLNSFEEELVPDINSIGYITTRENELKYPFLSVGTNNFLFFDENNELYLIK